MISLDTLNQLRDPRQVDQLRSQHGGHMTNLPGGGVSASIGNRPVPPPSAMRRMHMHRQEERQDREELAEATEFEEKHGMAVKETRTAWNLEPDVSVEATLRKRELAQRDLEAKLCDLAYAYEVHGSALPEVNGYYEYSVTSTYGAPVYSNKEGWNLHRDKPPAFHTIGTDDEVMEFGWVISRDRKPWYGSRTEELIAPIGNWQPFLGPMPPPSRVDSISWEKHLFEACGPLKDSGNTSIQQGLCEHAISRYTDAILQMDGYSDVVSASAQLQQLQTSLYANRAEAFVRCQQWEQALEDSRWVLERDPAHAKAGFRLAKACRALDRWDDAVGPLEKLLETAGSQGNAEVRALLTEAEVLSKCKSGESKLSGVYFEMKLLQDEVKKVQAGTNHDDSVVQEAARPLIVSLASLLEGISHDDVALRRDTLLLFRSVQLFDTVLELARQSDEKEYSLQLLSSYLWPYTDEKEVKRLIEALHGMASTLVSHPTTALGLVSKLLQHRQRKSLRVADHIIETPGLLAKCLRRWAERLDEVGGRVADQAAVVVFRELEAQCLRLDNLEALSLAFFVECFIGERTEEGVSGGFLLYHGSMVRQVVLSSLRRWNEDKRVLKFLKPSLVARAWESVLVKTRRDASIDREKQIGQPLPDGSVRKIEWFRLKPPAKLRRDIGAFFSEDFLETFLDFLKAHFEATCERGFETVIEDGIAPRPPPEEWVEDVLDEPFAWGFLLPLVIGPPSIGSRAAALLEAVIKKYPHNEKLAIKLAGLQVHFPLISFPWPPTNTARSSLKETRALSSKVRRSLLVLLRCCIDTESALRQLRVDLDTAMQAVLDQLQISLMDRDEPDCLITALEIVGIIVSGVDAMCYISEDMVFEILKEFIRNNHSESRSQLAKFLRLIYRSQEVRPHFDKAMEDERLCLNNDQQRSHIMREIFDTKTLAGQHVAQKMIETSQKIEETPVEIVDPDQKKRQQVNALVDAIAEAYIKPDARVLVMGRMARPFCKRLAERQNPCKIILGDTTLEKIDTGELGSAVEPVLLPLAKAIANDAVLASQEHFDLVITGEPIGYYDVGEYADNLRPFIKRREEEDERSKDQVQWVCVETAERTEDARDEIYAGGYYNAEHDKAYEKLRSLARSWQHDVILLSLPSYEKERRKKHDQEKATERMVKREAEEAAKEKQEEDHEQRRGVLNEALFDPLLGVPEVSSLPVVYELGAEQGAADVVLFWMHANDEDPEVYRSMFEEVLDSLDGSVRIIVPTFPESSSKWYPWSDEISNNMGMEWYELQDDPTDEAAERAKKDPARHVSFGKAPTLEELQCLEEMEVSCKQLLNLAEEEVLAGMPDGAKIVFGGFSQGGGIAAYSAVSNTASEELKPYIKGLVQICAGVPVFQFLAAKLQAMCLKNREAEIFEQPIRVHMIYSEKDPEIKPTFVSTMKDLYKRFDYPVTLTRFQSSPEERLPRALQPEIFSRALRPHLPAEPLAG